MKEKALEEKRNKQISNKTKLNKILYGGKHNGNEYF